MGRTQIPQAIPPESRYHLSLMRPATLLVAAFLFAPAAACSEHLATARLDASDDAAETLDAPADGDDASEDAAPDARHDAADAGSRGDAGTDAPADAHDPG